MYMTSVTLSQDTTSSLAGINIKWVCSGMASTFSEVSLVYSANTSDSDLQMVEIPPTAPKLYNLSSAGLVSGAPYSFQLQVTDASQNIVTSNTIVIYAPWALDAPVVQSYVGHDSSLVIKLAPTANILSAGDTTVEFLLKRADNSIFWIYLPYSSTTYYTLTQAGSSYLVNNVAYRVACSFQPGPSNTRYTSPSAMSNTISATPSNTPNIPTGITTSSVGVSTLDLRVVWSRPSDFSEWSSTAYEIRVSLEVSSGYPLATRILSNADVTFVDLEPGRTYKAYVQYSNIFGDGPVGASSSGFQQLTERADAPILVSAEDGDGQSFVTWAPPSYQGQTPVTSYDVYKDGALYTTVTLPESGSSSPSFEWVVTGLTNGNSYSFYVIAKNVIGSSLPSNTLASCPYGDMSIVSAIASGKTLNVTIRPNGRPVTQVLLVGLSASPSVDDGSPIISIPQNQLSQSQSADIGVVKNFSSMQSALDFYAVVAQSSVSSAFYESR
jgi:titin